MRINLRKQAEPPHPSSAPTHLTDEVQGIVLDMVDHLDAMLAYWDINQVCLFANDAYRLWFGKSRAEIVGTTLQSLLGPLYEKNLPHLRAAYAGEVQVFERAIPTPSGAIRHSLATYTPKIVDGVVQGIFVHVADVTRLKDLEHELRAAKAEAEQLATHDFLTGLPNRVLLIDRINQACALATRSGQRLAGMSLDLDDFKQVNDRHGHQAGDELLVAVATRIRHAVRDIDTATRMGGDEFFLLCPNVRSREDLEPIARRILDRVMVPLNLQGATVVPSCSIGIALAEPAGVTPERLIQRSDEALYAAKRLGKGCFAFADD